MKWQFRKAVEQIKAAGTSFFFFTNSFQGEQSRYGALGTNSSF